MKVRGNRHIILGSNKVQVIMIGKGVTFLHILLFVSFCTHTMGLPIIEIEREMWNVLGNNLAPKSNRMHL